MASKKHSLKFKRKKLKTPEKNPIKELMNLYEEADNIEQEAPVEEKEVIVDETTSSLRNIIEKSRAKKRKRFVLMIFFLLFTFFAAALAGFVYFDKNKTFQEDDLTLNIEGPEKVKIGESIEYTIKYQNTGDVPLNNTSLAVQLPHGIVLDSTIPEIHNKQWELGYLDLYQSGEVKILGKIIDDFDQEQKITARLTFEPTNFNADFSKETQLAILLEKPNVNFNIEYPASVTLGQKISINTTIDNEEEFGFESPQFHVIYPENFEYSGGQPEPFEEDKKWQLDILTPESDDKEVTFEGKFPAGLVFETETDREQSFTLQLHAKGNDDRYFLVTEQEFLIKITDQALLSYLIVNGSADNKNIELGNLLTYSIVTKNNSSKAYDNLEIKMIIDSAPLDIIDWENINDDNYGEISKTDNGKELVWSSKDVSKLEDFQPGEELMITFAVPIKPYAQLENINADSLAETKISNIAQIILDGDENADIPPIKSNPVMLNLNSNLDLTAKALYYYDDGTPIGNGPYPPEVNESTQVAVFWDITNDIHDIEDISVTANLPKYVNVVGQPTPSVGQFSFDETTNQLTWKIETLPRTIKSANCTFNLQFTPNDKHSGQIIQLLSNSTLTARDSETKSQIVRTQNILTTALEQDKYITGDGAVK